MVSIGIIIVVIFIILTVYGLVILTIFNLRQIEREANNIVDPTGACTKATDKLIDINGLPCCCQSGQQTNGRFVKELDAVVAPTPTPYLTACAGFCKNGQINTTNETCLTGTSDKFTSCINLIKPVNCNTAAFPVAVVDTQFYYIQSASQDTCQKSGSCAPGANTCPSSQDFF